MPSESSLGDDLGLSVHSIGSNHHSRSGVVMSNIYRAAAAVSSSSPVPRRNGSVGSFREAPSHNSAVSRTLNSNGSPGNSPANSRKATKEGSQMHLLTQVNTNIPSHSNCSCSLINRPLSTNTTTYRATRPVPSATASARSNGLSDKR